MNSSASQTSGSCVAFLIGVVVGGGLLRRGSGWPRGRPVAALGLGMVLKMRVGLIVIV